MKEIVTGGDGRVGVLWDRARPLAELLRVKGLAESSWGGDARLRAEGRSGWMWRGWGVWFGRDE